MNDTDELVELKDKQIAELKTVIQNYRLGSAWKETDRIEMLSRLDELERALNSIANNSCCGDCQEAKLVAIAALKEKIAISRNIQMSNKLMLFDPRTGNKTPYPSQADQFREWHGRDAWLFNPWTGVPRHYSDIGSDPCGILIHPGLPLKEDE